MRIVLVEDDIKLSELLTEYFVSNGFVVTTVHDGGQAVNAIIENEPDLVLLDLMLPNVDGLSICREIRGLVSSKIMVLTATGDDFDHVAALEMGADDFVSKPIKPRVLLARIKNILRQAPSTAIDHSSNTQNSADQSSSLSLNAKTKRCFIQGKEIELTEGEFDLLHLFVSNPNQALSREFLVQQTRGISYDGVDRTIDNKVVLLRKKLGDNTSRPKMIVTVRGQGYLFVRD
ncbi:DNA-binding response regulator [Veronia nyctiphanis]|uniref:DNA-binding response regulator n=1 Tax=Veronia nyctiphanis TaxID=1278244 RepID=A0A4Q0YKB4_9GAMM|nr:response regulator transcription factor [Veronia nyctiphanis]RXJ70855.1 DNA-binding response regulator [Veronia nyctiphanis]